MTRLEDLTTGSLVRGVLAERSIRIVQVEWHGSNALTLTYTDASGRPGQELLYRDDEPRLAVQEPGRVWSLDADGHLFRLVSEARRISLAHLFDPFLAVQVSTLEPLPHQIDAVYSRMLPIQPLRFLLADDPGAGKTIMAGLFCKELAIRSTDPPSYDNVSYASLSDFFYVWLRRRRRTRHSTGSWRRGSSSPGRGRSGCLTGVSCR
jgi:hypothetical protein